MARVRGTVGAFTSKCTARVSRVSPRETVDMEKNLRHSKTQLNRQWQRVVSLFARFNTTHQYINNNTICFHWWQHGYKFGLGNH
jgi:hypothetical protein